MKTIKTHFVEWIFFEIASSQRLIMRENNAIIFNVAFVTSFFHPFSITALLFRKPPEKIFQSLNRSIFNIFQPVTFLLRFYSYCGEFFR